MFDIISWLHMFQIDCTCILRSTTELKVKDSHLLIFMVNYSQSIVNKLKTSISNAP